MQESTLVLFGAALLLMEVAAVGLFRGRTIKRRAAAIRTASRSLFFARHMHQLVTRWSAVGPDTAGLMLCRMALHPLREAHDALAKTGDDCQSVLIDLELGRNAELMHLCRRGMLFLEWALIPRKSFPWRALQLARLNLWLEEASSLSTQAADQFSAHRYRAAHATYCTVRERLLIAHTAARSFGRTEYLPTIREAMEYCRRAIAACSEWMYGGEFDTEAPRRLYMKGRINPYFRRDDGSSPPRPERPGFWGATGRVPYP